MSFLENFETLKNDNNFCLNKIDEIEKKQNLKSIKDIVQKFYSSGIDINKFIDDIEKDEKVKELKNSKLIKGSTGAKELKIEDLVKNKIVFQNPKDKEIEFKEDEISNLGTDKLKEYLKQLAAERQKVINSNDENEIKKRFFTNEMNKISALSSARTESKNIKGVIDDKRIISLKSMQEITGMINAGNLESLDLNKIKENIEKSPLTTEGEMSTKTLIDANKKSGPANQKYVEDRTISEYYDKLDEISSYLSKVKNVQKDTSEAGEIIDLNSKVLENIIKNLDNELKSEESKFDDYLKTKQYDNMLSSAQTKIDSTKVIFGHLKKHYDIFKGDKNINSVDGVAQGAISKDKEFNTAINGIDKIMEHVNKVKNKNIFKDIDSDVEVSDEEWGETGELSFGVSPERAKKEFFDVVENVIKEINNIETSANGCKDKNNVTYKDIIENVNNAKKTLNDLKSNISDIRYKQIPSKDDVTDVFNMQTGQFSGMFNSIKDDQLKTKIKGSAKRIMDLYSNTSVDKGLDEEIEKFCNELKIGDSSQKPAENKKSIKELLEHQQYKPRDFAKFLGRVNKCKDGLSVLKLKLKNLQSVDKDIKIENIDLKNIDKDLVNAFEEQNKVDLGLDGSNKQQKRTTVPKNPPQDPPKGPPKDPPQDPPKDNIPPNDKTTSTTEGTVESKIENDVNPEDDQESTLVKEVKKSKEDLNEDVFKKDQLNAIYEKLLSARKGMLDVGSSVKQNPTGFVVDSKQGVIDCLKENVIGRKKSFFKKNFVPSASNAIAKNIISVLDYETKVNKEIKKLVNKSKIDEDVAKNAKKSIKNYVKRSNSALEQKDLKEIIDKDLRKLKWPVKSKNDESLDKKDKKAAVKDEKQLINGWKKIIKSLLELHKRNKAVGIKLEKVAKNKKALFSNKNLNKILKEILIEAECIIVLSACLYIHLYTGTKPPGNSPMYKLNLEVFD